MKGNGGISNKGTAVGSSEEIWMKWRRMGGVEGLRDMAVRCWGMVLRWDSSVRQEYFSSLFNI